MEELARKNFNNLRQDSDENEPETKVARRGRPPTKHLKKPLGRPPVDRAGSSDATLATGGEKTMPANFDLRRGPFSADKLALLSSSGRLRNHDVNSSWLLGSRFGRNDEYAGLCSRICPVFSRGMHISFFIFMIPLITSFCRLLIEGKSYEAWE